MDTKDFNVGRTTQSLFGIREPGRPGFQLGRIHPNDVNKRLSAHNQHTQDNWQPRAGPTNPLIEPLPIREQTQTSHRVSLQFRMALSSGFRDLANEGRTSKRFTGIDPISIGPAIEGAQMSAQTTIPRNHGVRPSYRKF